MSQRLSWLLVIALVGCSPVIEGDPDGMGGTGGTGGDGIDAIDASAPDPDDGIPPPDALDAAALYARHCAMCHGPARLGGAGPALVELDYTVAALTARITDTMPPANPGACVGDCAATLADWLLDGADAPLDCAEAAPELLPRRLRLLTRREYDAAVADLLWPDAADADAPCGQITFAFPAEVDRGAGRVVVAGTFNDWSPDRGLPLAYDAAADAWTGTHVIGEGIHRYKFVADDARWYADPDNDWTEADGFGGLNSVVELRCGAVVPGGRPSRGLPPETRPDGYPFDNHADAAQVDAATLESYLEAAEGLADAGLAADACRGDCLALLPRALRRAPTDAERGRYRALLDGPDGQRAFLVALLASPHFLYRAELGEPVGDGTWRLTGPETASALAFYLTGAPPDAALRAAAEAGELTPDGIERHARRLLQTPRARATLGAFAEQWLGIEPLPLTVRADPALDAATRDALLAATRRFVGDLVLDGPHDFASLLTAEHTYANDAIARLYGLDPLDGPALRRIDAPPARAAGLLGHGSVLATYAHADQSSPIRRGLFVRRRLLCQDLPPPPPDAGGVPDVDPSATTRERFAQHTDDPFCHACHRYIDDVGFGFEGFDAIGRRRDTEGGRPIDETGDMNDVEGLGTATRAPYHGLPALGAVLADSHAARQCFVTQVRRFALGAPADDPCATEALTAAFAAEGDDIRELMIRVATHPSFTLRRAEVAE